ncbi:MAG: hypothetical protein ABFS56_09465 [Pseudomonadota bacterium]
MITNQRTSRKRCSLGNRINAHVEAMPYRAEILKERLWAARYGIAM